MSGRRKEKKGADVLSRVGKSGEIQTEVLMSPSCGSWRRPHVCLLRVPVFPVTPVDSRVAHLQVLVCVSSQSKDPALDADSLRTPFDRQWDLYSHPAVPNLPTSREPCQTLACLGLSRA